MKQESLTGWEFTATSPSKSNLVNISPDWPAIAGASKAVPQLLMDPE